MPMASMWQRLNYLENHNIQVVHVNPRNLPQWAVLLHTLSHLLFCGNIWLVLYLSLSCSNICFHPLALIRDSYCLGSQINDMVIVTQSSISKMTQMQDPSTVLHLHSYKRRSEIEGAYLRIDMAVISSGKSTNTADPWKGSRLIDVHQ